MKWTTPILLLWFVALSATAHAQGNLPKVGILWIENASFAAPALDQFKEGLRDLGWIHGRTVELVERYDQGDASRRPRLAGELVGLGVNVIYVTDPIVPAARRATLSIPIVCGDSYDPVAEGYAKSLAKPEGNITGISWQSLDSAVKRLQLAKELVPNAKQIGMMVDAKDSGALLELGAVRAAAKEARVTLRAMELRTPEDVEAAVGKLKGSKLDALIISGNSLTWPAIGKIVEVASANGIATISEPREFAERGSVISYGADMYVLYRRGAHFVDRILRGARPSDLPFEQPTKFDLVINLPAAKRLGLQIPDTVLARATEVLK